MERAAWLLTTTASYDRVQHNHPFGATWVIALVHGELVGLAELCARDRLVSKPSALRAAIDGSTVVDRLKVVLTAHERILTHGLQLVNCSA